ncbi:IclR family transcriptional regulator C-terminal domain-containing protein [soil metagenome]
MTLDTAESDQDVAPKGGMLGRALTLLEIVSAHADGIGVREAARQTGIDRSAVSRILTQFEELGYVEQERERGVYAAGPNLFALVAGLIERDSLWKAAEPSLKALVGQFNETCYIAARVGDSLVFRGKVDCEHRIRYVIELGKPFPLVSGAAGTAIMAGLDEAESDRILEGNLPAYTPESITDAAEYRAQLRADRILGYTYSPGRWVRGGAGIAAPYFDASGRCAGAITLSCPADRLEDLHVQQVGEAVRDAAAALSRRLGYVAPS